MGGHIVDGLHVSTVNHAYNRPAKRSGYLASVLNLIMLIPHHNAPQMPPFHSSTLTVRWSRKRRGKVKDAVGYFPRERRERGPSVEISK